MNSGNRWLALAVCAVLVAINWLIFGQTLGHEFINLDDPAYVLKNPHVSAGLTSDGLIWAFTHSHATNWHPVTWISHMLDCRLYGLNPRGHHLTNVLLHMTTAVTLFLVFWQMTTALWRSAFVAAVFAVHPLRVESVAWVAERKDVLSALFFVLTLGAYLHFTRRPSNARYALILLLFAIGLMCKPMLVSVPLVLLLLDYWPLNRFAQSTFRRLLLEKLPFLGLATVVCVVTVLAQGVAAQRLMKVPLSLRLGNAALSCVAYLRDMFWPANLSALYPFDLTAIRTSAVLPALLLLSGISVIIYLLRGRRYLVAGWLWYLIMLGPVIGILQVGEQARADRYTYLPQIGLYFALTWAIADLRSRWRQSAVFLGTISVTIVAALAFVARAQTAHWQDSETLWRHTLAHTSNNGVAHRFLGHALFVKGKRDEAIAEFEQSLQIDERQDMSHVNLGITLLGLGRVDQAIAHFGNALVINPNCADAHANLGMVLLELGRPDESLTHLEEALAIEPDFATAHYNLGNTLLKLGRAREAVAHYRKAVDLDPKDTAALNNMAWILATSPDAEVRDGGKAIALAESADSLATGKEPLIAATLAASYAEAGRFDDATKEGQRAIELATSQGNAALAESIRAQVEFYLVGSPFRDQRNSATSR